MAIIGWNACCYIKDCLICNMLYIIVVCIYCVFYMAFYSSYSYYVCIVSDNGYITIKKHYYVGKVQIGSEKEFR